LKPIEECLRPMPTARSPIAELPIRETFRPRPLTRWRRTQAGGGQLVLHGEGLRLALPAASSRAYANVMLDDYAGLARSRFPWRPPLRLTVRARASGALAGTAGFGFWNNPGGLPEALPWLPAAIWFFHAAPPADLPLARGVPGHGWKAACLDATRTPALAWAPLAPAVLLLNRWPPAERRIWPAVQRALGIAEAAIPAAGPAWREYVIEWRRDGARFLLDGAPVLEADCAPRGPLGFVAWLDNQWAVVTPRGRLGWGLVAAGCQWLDLAEVRIE
jgi:hypothetical protein